MLIRECGHKCPRPRRSAANAFIYKSMTFSWHYDRSHVLYIYHMIELCSNKLC